MIIVAVLGSLAAIGMLSWLIFALAVFALPAVIGVTAGTWAYGTGAGWLGAVIVGFLAAGTTFAIGQLLLAFARPLWLKLLVVIGAIAVGVTAGARLTTMGLAAPQVSGRGVAGA